MFTEVGGGEGNAGNFAVDLRVWRAFFRESRFLWID